MYNEEDTFEALQLRIVIDKNGVKRYYNNDNELHRVNGPAVIYADGDKYWYLNGEQHRTDGPAAEWLDGTKFWYLNGKRHREDGPAIEWANGDQYWYINGQILLREDFLKHPLCTIK